MYGLWCCTRVLEGSAYCPGIQRESDRRDCANNGGISIFSIPQKIYERVFISRVIESTCAALRMIKKDNYFGGDPVIRTRGRESEKAQEW